MIGHFFLWLPDSPAHVSELLAAVRRIEHDAAASADYVHAVDQTQARFAALLAQLGINLQLPGVGPALVLGAAIAMGTVEANPHQPLQYLAGGVLSYALRATEGPAGPEAD